MNEPLTPFQLFRHLNTGGIIRLGNWTMKTVHSDEGEHIVTNGETSYYVQEVAEGFAFLLSLNTTLEKEQQHG